MGMLYDSGKIQAFAERILVLGCRFDDDGEIDVFLFGEDAHHVESMNIDNYQGFVNQMLRRYPLEIGTDYAKAMRLIRQFYFPSNNGGEETRNPTEKRSPMSTSSFSPMAPLKTHRQQSSRHAGLPMSLFSGSLSP